MRVLYDMKTTSTSVDMYIYVMNRAARDMLYPQKIKYDPRVPVCLKPVMGEERVRGLGCADTWDRRGSDHPTTVVTSKDIKKPLYIVLRSV